MSLRPALKACSTENDRSPFPFASSSTILDSPHVHFPPTPTLTSTALTHSPHAYDRAPIRVSPNSCALPDRGERVYSADDGRPPPESYFLPRRREMIPSLQAWADEHSALFKGSTTATKTPRHYDISPSLIADMSSESEDSDQCRSPQQPEQDPFVSVQLPNASRPYPFGGGFSRQPSYSADGSGIEDAQLAMGLLASPPRPRVKKQEQQGVAVEMKGGDPSLKKTRSTKDRLSIGERTRKLSSTRCITTTSCDASAEGCLGGF